MLPVPQRIGDLLVKSLQTRVNHLRQLFLINPRRPEKQKAVNEKIHGFCFPVGIMFSNTHTDLVNMVFHGLQRKITTAVSCPMQFEGKFSEFLKLIAQFVIDVTPPFPAMPNLYLVRIIQHTSKDNSYKQ